MKDSFWRDPARMVGDLPEPPGGAMAGLCTEGSGARGVMPQTLALALAHDRDDGMYRRDQEGRKGLKTAAVRGWY